jgi:hypothetical protein
MAGGPDARVGSTEPPAEGAGSAVLFLSSIALSFRGGPRLIRSLADRSGAFQPLAHGHPVFVTLGVLGRGVKSDVS